MGTGSNKKHYTVRSAVIKPIDQKKITADMTFTISCPISGQSMVKPLFSQRSIIPDQEQHSLFEAIHIIST
jgi:hypothetical protein